MGLTVSTSPAPKPTAAGLVATLALTVAAVFAFDLEAPATQVGPGLAGAFLWLFLGLFFLRVAGQVLVLLRAPTWLPPMPQWNLLPYRFLLPIQIVLLAVMAWVAGDLARGDGVFARPTPAAGDALIWFSYVYVGAMAARYAVRMGKRPAERWFGGTIPIVFHVVLAAYLFTLGTFHASY